MPGEIEVLETPGATVVVAPESSETPQETAVAESAAEVAQAAAVVAVAAANADPLDGQRVYDALESLATIIAVIGERLVKVEADVFLALGKLDELINLELEERDAEDEEAEEIAAAVVTETAPVAVVAETIPPETVAVIEEPEQRRQKARRFI